MAFVYHLAAFILTAVSLYEHTTFRKDLSLVEARRIQRMDIVYGVSAGVLLIVGLLHLELVAIALILFSATMMARGIGMM
jgi:putative membrane protein